MIKRLIHCLMSFPLHCAPSNQALCQVVWPPSRSLCTPVCLGVSRPAQLGNWWSAEHPRDSSSYAVNLHHCPRICHLWKFQFCLHEKVSYWRINNLNLWSAKPAEQEPVKLVYYLTVNINREILSKFQQEWCYWSSIFPSLFCVHKRLRYFSSIHVVHMPGHQVALCFFYSLMQIWVKWVLNKSKSNMGNDNHRSVRRRSYLGHFITFFKMSFLFGFCCFSAKSVTYF